MGSLRLVGEGERATKSACRVKVFLTYANEGRTPYKWRCDCSCGWGGLSWSWSRAYECYNYGYEDGPDPDQWRLDNGEPEGGALIMALEHVGLAPQQVWVPLFGAGPR